MKIRTLARVNPARPLGGVLESTFRLVPANLDEVRKTIIYGLCDPRTQHLRYIGKTSKELKIRVQKHLQRASRGETYHCANWLRQLMELGLAPEAFVIEEAPDDGCLAEVHHIAQFRSLGCDLTNGTKGGDGMPGWKHSAKTKAKIGGKMSIALKGRMVRLATRALISQKMVAYWAENPRPVLPPTFCKKCGRGALSPDDFYKKGRGWIRDCKLCTLQIQGLRRYCGRTCGECGKPCRTNVNGKCTKCNAAAGLAQCTKCKKLLPAQLSFWKGRTRCRTCSGALG